MKTRALLCCWTLGCFYDCPTINNAARNIFTQTHSVPLSGQRRSGEAYRLPGEPPLRGSPAPWLCRRSLVSRGCWSSSLFSARTNTRCRRTSAWTELEIPQSGVGSWNLVSVSSVVGGKKSALRAGEQELSQTFCVTLNKSLTISIATFMTQGPRGTVTRCFFSCLVSHLERPSTCSLILKLSWCNTSCRGAFLVVPAHSLAHPPQQVGS